jgi:hypothetical protein
MFCSGRKLEAPVIVLETRGNTEGLSGADVPPHVCSLLLITAMALNAFLQAVTDQNYIRGILQACDMTSRYLCFAWLQEWLLTECYCACCRWAWLSCGTLLATSVLCSTLRDVHIYCNLTLLLRTCYLLRHRHLWEGHIRSTGQKIRRFLWNPRNHYRVYGTATNPSSESFTRHCLLFRPSLNPVLSHHFAPNPSSESSLS